MFDIYTQKYFLPTTHVFSVQLTTPLAHAHWLHPSNAVNI